MLNEKILIHFKNLLVKQRSDLLGQAAETLQKNSQDSAIQGGDFADIASMESNKVLRLRLRDREQKLLAKIDESLAKIEKGVYGICVSCGSDIEQERLEARPVATMCIQCKRDQESQES
ncbi:RNA polymerase-binding protein DksA [bacterium]|nr:RNA polymerase-binding protein DksA [bacterium]